ncbi:uncharacterized protein MONBRDRAFT_8666 [Monosiga brevicollis MX1]|uniref:Uncharacterized protein n=1 Tax=Monosiga brevicollis TaxID=81824 RepID=A9V0R6_MONBE|nr:uncharacterized protein MONBRDRAFT_8666 [Monosiga brevicollis MX1]EDQ88682.1 predicted protein [Monosiga brevicollis MX1]|eukprot:XP_001746295.1 hypothetical protein [Monosiga brevicollis MX1]
MGVGRSVVGVLALLAAASVASQPPRLTTNNGVLDVTASEITAQLRSGDTPLRVHKDELHLTANDMALEVGHVDIAADSAQLDVNPGSPDAVSLSYNGHLTQEAQIDLTAAREINVEAVGVTFEAQEASFQASTIRMTGTSVQMISDQLQVTGAGTHTLEANESIAVSNMGESDGVLVTAESANVRGADITATASESISMQGQKAELRTSDAARAVTVASDGIQITSTGDVLLQGALNTLNVTHLAVLLRSMRADVDALKQQLNATRDQLTQRAAQTQSSSNNIEALMSSISSLLGTEDTHLSTEINQLNSQLTAAEQAQTLVVNNADANLDQELSGLESRAAQVSRAFPSLEDAIDTAFDSVEAEYDRIGDVLDDRVDSVADIIDDLERDLEDRLDDVADEAVDVREDVADAIEDVKDDAQEFSEDLGQAQQDLASAVGDMVGDLSSAAADRAEVSAEVSTSYRSAQVASANVADSAADMTDLRSDLNGLEYVDRDTMATVRLRGKQVLSDVNGVKELLLGVLPKARSQYLSSPAVSSDYFGRSCSFYDDIMACGAPYYSTYGYVFIYRVFANGSQPALIQSITWPTTTSTPPYTAIRFGESVALSKSYLMIGAPLYDHSTYSYYRDCGAVLAYRRQADGTFTFVNRYSYVTTSSTYRYGLCGSTLSIDEVSPTSTYVNVGCPGTYYYRGGMRLLYWSGTSFSSRTFVHTGYTTYEYSTSVYMNMGVANAYVMVGEQGYSSSRGRSVIYERTSNSYYTLRYTAYPPTSSSTQYCGQAVATDGINFLMGCPRSSYASTTTTYTGIVVHYRRSGTSFSRVGTLESDELQTYGYFGSAMAIEPYTKALLVSEYGANSYAGRIHVFKLGTTGTYEREYSIDEVTASLYLGRSTVGWVTNSTIWASNEFASSNQGSVALYQEVEYFESADA